MQAQDIRITELIDGQKQFIIPVFQRDYSWGTKHCLQLWDDVLRVGSDKTAKAHFVGSVVYIEAEETSANITRWLLIDGQQRLTTVTLLLAALRKRIIEEVNTNGGVDYDDLPTAEAIKDSYLINRHAKGDRRFKLHLRRADHETLIALLDGKDMPLSASDRVIENYAFFEEQLKDADLPTVFRGLRKLVAVDVHLTRGQDNPQMIFESLNSTGLDLTQADLIRNFVLMRQDEELQTRLYEDYWRPIEIAFGPKYRTEFDKFVRDFLTIKLKPSKQLKSDEIYKQFRTFFESESREKSTETILEEVKRFGLYYVGFSLGKEENKQLQEAIGLVRTLVEVASPLFLQLYEYYSERKTLSLSEFIEASKLIESYVFRRGVCDMQTRSLYQIFASITYRLSEKDSLQKLKAILHQQGKKRRFPSDTEFREALETRDVYDMRTCHYLLDRIENDSKERVDTSGYTIEHVLPQNEELPVEWQKMLGAEWRSIQETWQHRLGNLTLTGYNSEYSDLPFNEKKALVDNAGRKVGLDFSPLRLNQHFKKMDHWTQKDIEERGKQLAAQALSIWPPLKIDLSSVRTFELEELKTSASKHKIDDLAFGSGTRVLFDELQKKIKTLGDDIVELPGENTITYRVYEFFVEVIPRKRRLTLVLNLDFGEIDDPTQRATDASERAFIINATESGGVLFRIEEPEDIDAAVHLVRQAYEKVSE